MSGVRAIRLALRSLLRERSFAGLVVLTSGLGVATATAVYSLI